MKTLKEAEKERDDFLKEHPHLEEYQKEINEVLDKCTSQEDRLIALLIMLNNKVNELKELINV